MHFMDWEKQDNELRKLMDGSEFLPEGELWDAGKTWEKLQMKNRPVKRNKRVIWLRLAAAACAVGLLGIGVMRFQLGSLFTKPGNGMVKTTEVNSGLTNENIKSIANHNKGLEKQSIPKPIIALQKKQNSLTSIETSGSIKEKSSATKQNRENEGLNELAYGSNKHKVPLDSMVTKEVEVNPESGMLAEKMATGINPQIMAVIPAPAKKMKVLHYNELKGNGTTPPPGFALIKKSQFEWENIAMQASSTPKEPSFQLKIELSPATKKSL